MVEPTNNYRYTFISDTLLGTRQIAEKVNFDQSGNVYKLTSQGRYFKREGDSKVTLLEDAKDYVMEIIDRYGPDQEVRLLVEVKDDKPLEEGQAERWVTLSNDALDLYSIEENSEAQNQQISVSLITGGTTQLIESRFKDQYDITAQTNAYDDKSDLPFVDVWLEARVLFRRTRWAINNGTAGQAGRNVLAGFGVPFEVLEDSRSDINAQTVAGGNLFFDSNSAQPTSSGIFYNNAQRPRTLQLEMDLNVIFRPDRANFIAFYLYVFENGEQYDFVSSREIARVNSTGGNLDSPVNTQWSETITVLEGQSLAIGAVHSDFPTKDVVDITYADSSLSISENDRFDATCTRALKPVDLFQKMADLIGVKWDRESTPFREGGPFENYLMVHGTWLRNVPQIVNQNQEDERRVQSNISLEFLYGVYNMLAPLRYGQKFTEGENKFFVGYERETQQDYVSISLKDNTGNLQEAAEKGREILAENYYSRFILGSNTSGSNYGEVNNLFSIGGRAEWRTPNTRSEAAYEITSDVRTGAEDIELCRQLQWSANPGQDSEYDDQWFLIDTKFAPEVNPDCPYITKKWFDYFDQVPRGVFSPESNYNWPFRPSQLLFNHSWKIAPSIWVYANRLPLIFNSSNCNSSLITRVAGQSEFKEDQDIFFGSTIGDPRFSRPTVRLWKRTFRVAMTQELIEQLAGDKNGLVEYLWNSEISTGRILEASDTGEFTIIEAR